MNSPSSQAVHAADALNGFATAPVGSVGPFEFRSLVGEDIDATDVRSLSQGRSGIGCPAVDGRDPAAREVALRKAVEGARQEGFQQGEREGRQAARLELEAEMRGLAAIEHNRLLAAVVQFRAAREHYFADVEQEVVKLALAIAARVLHREAQIDPLLLSGAVRVALEKMADRTGVVVRVAEPAVEEWDRVFAVTQETERPRVVGDARLKRGECVLETRMGTVELGVSVQLGEIEKGFFDLLNHRPLA